MSEKDKKGQDKTKKKSSDGQDQKKKSPKTDFRKLAEEYLDGWKRCQADFDNYKKRQEGDRKKGWDLAQESLILQILPVLDNFSSAVKHIPKEAKNDSWVEGIIYIKKQLENILKDSGIEEIDLKPGDKFDENLCEAVEMEELVKTKEKNESDILYVKKVLTKGYRKGDKVIRAAKVIVGNKK